MRETKIKKSKSFAGPDENRTRDLRTERKNRVDFLNLVRFNVFTNILFDGFLFLSFVNGPKFFAMSPIFSAIHIML